MSTQVDICLELNGWQMDLRVPSVITLSRLESLLSEVFKDKARPLPAGWSLRLKRKSLNVGNFDCLNDFPIGNGDIFQIVLGEAYAAV